MYIFFFAPVLLNEQGSLKKTCDKARDLVSVISNKLVLIEEKRTSRRKKS